ncbi:MAG: TIGR02301 family protein [Beijerinckiaceae bacterium]|nr:TIGR02301 family protein [Beijerinckiaceae bacterium]
MGVPAIRLDLQERQAPLLPTSPHEGERRRSRRFTTARVSAALFCLSALAPAAWADPAPPPAVIETKPYDPSLMRLAEVLGALSYLRGLCGEKDAAAWHARMQALLDAEGTTPTRKDHLAGAFNSGLQGYALSYRTCTPNARVIIDRFLSEASRITKTLENRFGPG